jgi:hypothetical protein
MQMNLKAMAGVATLATLLTGAHALATDLVSNGGFEMNTGNGQVGFNTSITDWAMEPSNAPGYTFLFASGTGDTTGANGQFGSVSIWGPGNGSANGLPASSPAGGYYIASDSAFQQDAIKQTITGLTPGASYNVSFWWGAGQQNGFTGDTQSQWQVTLGTDTQSTPFANVSSLGFSGWMFQTFTYTAEASTEVLAFFANGSPQVPPLALLDGVSLQAAIPEASTWAMMVVGFAGLGFAAFGRRRLAAART